jgi:glycosyltransferase involved in cell wall biosynthesis
VLITVVSVVYKNLEDLERTCDSLDRQDVRLFEHIVVASGLSAHDRLSLLEEWNAYNRRFIFDQDSSLYNAMNIGLRVAKGDWIVFLNGGDRFASADTILTISQKARFSCMAFATAQVYEEDIYIRPPCSFRQGKVSSCGHQGFVVPLERDPSRRTYYDESNYIGADQEWIRINVDRYGLSLHNDILAYFFLGGLSNRPTVKALWLQIQSRNFDSALKLPVKLFLYALFGPRRYYRTLAMLKGYKVL